MSVPPVAPRSSGARFECVIDFIESYFRRLDDLGTRSPSSQMISLSGQSANSQSRLREPPHSNPLAQGKWVPSRTAFAPCVESQGSGVRGERARNAMAERLKHPAYQKSAAVKSSLTLFWLILARHKQAP